MNSSLLTKIEALVNRWLALDQGSLEALEKLSGKVIALELEQPGKLSPQEFDRAVRDLVNFMAYMAEPAKHEREQLGVKVILFLLVFLVVAYLMKKEFWKDVH